MSLCRKSGSGINRCSSEREGEKEGRREGRRDGKGRRERGKMGERERGEREKGREKKDRERQSNQSDEDQKSQSRTWTTEEAMEGWLRHLYRQVSEHSPSYFLHLFSRS